MGVVKSDAYGHGLVTVARALAASGVDYLGVANVDEAMTLRRHGVVLPIMILCGIRTREEAHAAVTHRLAPTLYDQAAVQLLMDEATRLTTQAQVFVKVDTGMGRLGVTVQDLGPLLVRLAHAPQLAVQGLTSHLAAADDADPTFSATQIRTFESAVQVGRALGHKLPGNNLANSAGLMRFRDAHFNMVRPGIMLYGGRPSPTFNAPVTLKPVMRLSADVIQVRQFGDQTTVSYGRTYTTCGPRTIAAIAAGYADGLPRSLSNCGHVLIHGRKVPITGRICMNITLVDVTALPAVQPGDEAVFLGSQQGATITADDVALTAGTISYEVLCSAGSKRGTADRA
jgi:alanine racemase